MHFLTRRFTHARLTTKLVALLGLFACIPMALVGAIAFKAADDSIDTIGQQFEYAAINIADTIDRNLFERYGDVQAFGLNTVLHETTNWYSPDEKKNRIIAAMNQYVDTYDIYFLTILVDPDGRLIAVNNRDADGKPIKTESLYRKNYADTAWFRALKTQTFTTKMPFTAPGNDVLTGTYVEDLHQDKEVQESYAGIDGLTLGFSAPVYQNGKVVAYWSNRAKYSLVEEIAKFGAQDLKTAGHAQAEITILDSEGRVIVDYDPARTGSEQVVRDFGVIGKLNLANEGLGAAQRAVKGERGYVNARHVRKGIMQAMGYAHLKGAMGFAGMNWSILVRSPLDEAARGARTIQRNVLITALVCLLLVAPIGVILGRTVVRRLSDIIGTAQAFSHGDLTLRSAVTTHDEVGNLAQAFNEMGDNLTKTILAVRETADSVGSAAEQITKGNEDLSQRTSHQASSLEETSASMEEMTSTVKQNADNARQANQLGNAAREVAERGGAVVTKAVASMEEINKSSKKIADIITVIDEIAFQTNLLALNAAVEAARAGEHGRGFAVVAAEVRNLAQRSASAAKEIKGLINESVQKVTDGSDLVNQSGKTLEEIVTSVKRVTDIIAEISAASQEQAQGIDQVNKAIMQMDEATQQNAALVEQTTSASQSMKEQAKELMRQVAVFKVGRTADLPSMKPETTPGRKTAVASHTPRPSPAPTVTPPAPSASTTEVGQPVGMAAGHGHDRHRPDVDFEEF